MLSIFPHFLRSPSWLQFSIRSRISIHQVDSSVHNCLHTLFKSFVLVFMFYKSYIEEETEFSKPTCINLYQRWEQFWKRTFVILDPNFQTNLNHSVIILNYTFFINYFWRSRTQLPIIQNQYPYSYKKCDLEIYFGRRQIWVADIGKNFSRHHWPKLQCCFVSNTTFF